LIRDKVVFILEPTDQAKAAIGKRVTVVDYPHGRLAIRYPASPITPSTSFGRPTKVPIDDNKRLGAVRATIRDQQLRREPEHRSDRAPRRRDQQNARLFKVGGAETATG
jgi:hypothetical protein